MNKILLLLTMCVGVYAQDTELMNQFLVQYNATSSTMVTGYFRTRINVSQDAGQFMQVKPGLILDHALTKNKHLFLQGGYYNQSTLNSDHETYTNLHRIFGGPRWIFLEKNNNRLETRMLFEQFYTPSGTSVFSRSRDRVMWEYINHKYIPSASYEYLRTLGVNYNRFNWMIRKQVNPHTQTGIGFEFRQMPDGRYHRIIWTNVIYKIK
jgi:hypothetical protein